MSEFLARIERDEVHELLSDISDEMVSEFGISRKEAVARINQQWDDKVRFVENDVVLHEEAHYWALFIYYGGEVPEWDPLADRSAWRCKAAPPDNSKYWTIGR